MYDVVCWYQFALECSGFASTSGYILDHADAIFSCVYLYHYLERAVISGSIHLVQRCSKFVGLNETSNVNKGHTTLEPRKAPFVVPVYTDVQHDGHHITDLRCIEYVTSPRTISAVLQSPLHLQNNPVDSGNTVQTISAAFPLPARRISSHWKVRAPPFIQVHETKSGRRTVTPRGTHTRKLMQFAHERLQKRQERNRVVLAQILTRRERCGTVLSEAHLGRTLRIRTDNPSARRPGTARRRKRRLSLNKIVRCR